MSKEYAVLPCNGLDKCAGCVAREVAIRLSEETGSELICPVFFRVAEARYHKLAQEKPLLVIDGCASRCASKLAAEKGLKIAQKIDVSEKAKSAGIPLGTAPRLTEDAQSLVEQILRDLRNEPELTPTVQDCFFPEILTYETYKKDKFVFRLPHNSGFFFNENDVWAYVSGNKARIGITDFIQKSLSDIMFFTPPTVGAALEQFEEAGSLESGKAVFEVISPVSGTVTAVNDNLANAPELLNENPYEQGWVAELELSDFQSDQELLRSFDDYFAIMKRKVDEFHV